MTIAVTGATGFVGQALLDEASAQGLSLRALTRKPQAPRAGIEWALGSLALNPAACPTPPNPFTVDGFTLAFTCSALSFDESGATRVVYSLTSNASQGTAPGGVAYVERNVSATVEK